MTDPILHHNPASPYAEKIRSILGYKKLRWHSVLQPRVMPKPDLLTLTGGYRRTPVLQIGRDVYCDTRLIVRAIERLAPEPALVPAAHRASIAAFAELEQTLFLGGVATNFSPAGLRPLMAKTGAAEVEALVRDRAALFSGGTVTRPTPEFSKTHFLPLLYALDQQLDARAYLLDDEPTLADFIAYHPIWYVDANEATRTLLAPFRRLGNWRERLQAIGHGESTELTREDALRIARESPDGSAAFDGPLLMSGGLALGQPVRVHATDYGVDPIEGTLAHLSVFEIVLRRHDERAGEVLVHCPRNGFAISPR